MHSRIMKFSLIGCAAVFMAVIIFGSGFMVGRFTTLTTRSSYLDSSRAELANLFEPYFEVWDLVHEKYIEQPVNDVNLIRASIRGMVKGLEDPHSSYMDPDEYRRYNTPLEGEYTGIGAWVDTGGDYLTIISPIPGSPAEKAGIKAGDIVVALDSKDMQGVHPELVYKQLLGPAGTKITITVVRKGEPKPLVFEIIRAVIKISSVTSEMLEGKIAYIRIIQFSLDSDKEFRTAFNELLKSEPAGLILDLRGNTGGFVDTAVQITSEFIKQGTAMIEEYEDGSKKNYPILGNGIALEIPLVVLVDRGSASASEITAGAIQDYGRGTLVGTTTYGKGSVQSWIPLQGDNGAVRITVARWLTPNGRQINNNGLTPDVIVEFTEDDIKTGRDVQREKAIELLLQKVKGGK